MPEILETMGTESEPADVDWLGSVVVGGRRWHSVVVRNLVALDIHARAEFVNRLRTIWDAGDAVLPVDLAGPRRHVESILHSMAPSAVIDAGGDRVRLEGGSRSRTAMLWSSRRRARPAHQRV
ncbi:MAG: hypothetical protein R2735_03150 [Microthrixaceae bacterium]